MFLVRSDKTSLENAFFWLFNGELFRVEVDV